jgi:hypothetical protein
MKMRLDEAGDEQAAVRVNRWRIGRERRRNRRDAAGRDADTDRTRSVRETRAAHHTIHHAASGPK